MIRRFAAVGCVIAWGVLAASSASSQDATDAGGNAAADRAAADRAAADREWVGRGADGRTVTPVQQVVTPVGLQVELAGMRPQAVALSPDGRLLVTSGKTNEIVVVDPETGAITDRVRPPADDVTTAPAADDSARNLQPDPRRSRASPASSSHRTAAGST